MREGINLFVRTQQRGLEQHTPLQRFGITHRSHVHIEPCAGFYEGRDISSDHDHGNIFCGKNPSVMAREFIKFPMALT